MAIDIARRKFVAALAGAAAVCGKGETLHSSSKTGVNALMPTRPFTASARYRRASLYKTAPASL